MLTRGPQALANLVLSFRLMFLFILLGGCGSGACHSHSPSLGPPQGPQGGSRRASLCPQVGDVPGSLWDLGPRRVSLIPRQDHPSAPR